MLVYQRVPNFDPYRFLRHPELTTGKKTGNTLKVGQSQNLLACAYNIFMGTSSFFLGVHDHVQFYLCVNILIY